MERICLHCHQLFTPTKKYPAKVYCSRGCVMRMNAIAARLPPFTCKQCGQSFTSKHGDAQYCSQHCAGISSHIHRMRRPIADRFWKNVDKTDYCWNWIGTLSTHGYGQISINRRWRLAPRIAWELYYGESPGKNHVLHRCDNPRCVREDHLFLGTHQDNMKDMLQKQRHHHGETHRSHKLTEQDVRDIRASTLSHAELTKMYPVGQSVISRIRARKAWRHVQ